MDVNEIMDTVENTELPEISETERTERTDTTEITETEQSAPLVSFPEEKEGENKKNLPFPAEDYKDGKLKPVRKRMLKKLMKY